MSIQPNVTRHKKKFPSRKRNGLEICFHDNICQGFSALEVALSRTSGVMIGVPLAVSKRLRRQLKASNDPGKAFAKFVSKLCGTGYPAIAFRQDTPKPTRRSATFSARI